ncbi:hypothetical protein [Streptomyces lasiicapitis]|uniref:hypothetical protein n=1 Tax=Streptomyces lasiicapitis TaxID=1923961 RepID=UPI0036576486
MSEKLAHLAAQLQHLHREAGEPSYREIGRKIKFSHTTVMKTIKCESCPSWQVLEKIVVFLGGDIPEFKKLWKEIRNDARPLPPLDSPLGPVGPLKSDRMKSQGAGDGITSPLYSRSVPRSTNSVISILQG